MKCGTDIIEISRIKESIEKYGETFIDRIYSPHEIEYCEKKGQVKYQHYAARFASKEAVAKMLGTGFNGAFEWKEIEVINDELGKPQIKLSGGAKKIFDEEKLEKIDISLSHCKEYAVAMVIGY
jgi:holo-[acyl-carrier protein] synthase